MKATQRDFAALAPKAALQCHLFYFCGQDEAGAFAAAERIAGILTDPGERIELSGSDLKRDPVRLDDEARSTSLFGGARHIFVRATGDEVYDAVANLLESDVPPCPVLIVTTAATDKSRTAKLLASREDALVAMFYPPDLSSVTSAVRQMADAAGLQMGGDLAERIARAANLDVRLAQSEVTKLSIYLDAAPQAPRAAKVEDLDAIGASTEEDGFSPLVNTVLSGEVGRLAGELKRMRDLSLNPVGLLLAMERRVAQLAQLSAKLGPRGDVAGLLEAETRARRVFFKDKRDLATQLRQWQGRKLERLVQRLVALHQALVSGSHSADIVLAQGLADITRAAARRR